MSDKAPDAFRTISEVAEDLDLPQHVLRFWETRFPQIKPLKRGGGRRYYRPDDVILLRGIRHLLYGEGYTIKGVQRILKESGVKAVQDVWRGQAEGLPEPVAAAPLAPTGDWRADEDDDAAPAFEANAAGDPSDFAGPEEEDASALSQEAQGHTAAQAEPPEAFETPASHEPSRQEPQRQEAGRYARPANVSIVRGGLHREAAGPKGPDAPVAAPAQRPASGALSSDDVQTLKAVLYELLETRKALDLAINRR